MCQFHNKNATMKNQHVCVHRVIVDVEHIQVNWSHCSVATIAMIIIIYTVIRLTHNSNTNIQNNLFYLSSFLLTFNRHSNT